MAPSSIQSPRRAPARALTAAVHQQPLAHGLGALTQASCALIVHAEVLVLRARPDRSTVEIWTLTAPARW